MSALGQYNGIPGMATAVVSSEANFLWGQNNWYLLKGIVVSSAAVDSGASPTTDLRPGLAMGKLTSGGEYIAYNDTATDGSGVCEGFLFSGVRTVSSLSGSAEDRLAQLVVAGPVKASYVYGLDYLARAQLFGRIIFDDDLVGNRFGAWRQVVAKTADYTVLAASDRDTLFTNQGDGDAINFTLPTIALGLRFGFYCEAGQTLTVTSAVADTLVTFNDAAADSVSFGTASKKIGGMFEVIANADATKWLVIPHLWSTAADGSGSNTVTIVTA